MLWLIRPTDQAGLMEFRIASRLRREHQAPEPPGFIAGTVPDMAPERKNRSIDSRSEAYALDGTFYEVLNGNLPFTDSDPVQWLDCRSRDIRRYLTIERRVCRHVSLRSR